MLVLSRAESEQIVIDAFDKDGQPVVIAVTFVEFCRGKARLGITAPESIPVHRKEVRDRIRANSKAGNPV